MMGDGNAPDIFMRVYDKSIKEWQWRVRDDSKAMYVECGIANELHDGSTVVFADDVLKFQEVRDHKKGTLARDVEESDEQLSEALKDR
eukprot:1323853-Lingulodinium_polyedra.AAC.1